MDSSDAIQFLILIILICLSAFFSSAETSMTTVNKIRIQTLAQEGDGRAETLLKVIENPGKLLSTILIGNNIVNLSASSLATTLTMRLFGNAAVGISTGIITLLVLIFGEITPKTLASIHQERLALAYAKPIRILMIIMTPVIFLMNHISGAVLTLLGSDTKPRSNTITEMELRTLVNVGHEEGVIESDEKKMIYNVFDFGDSVAKDIMVPRTDMACIDAEATYEEFMEVVREQMYTRYPVYEETTDHVIGIINIKDVLLAERHQEFCIRDYLREPYYTYEYMKTADLMVELRKTQNNIAIVLDEYGATAGLITLEDMLEEIVGEIRDEYDEDEEDFIRRLGPSEYVVEASMHLDDLNDLLGLSLESEDYDSIGGFMIGMLDHLPEQGEEVTFQNLRLVADQVDGNRIDKVHIYLTEEPKEQPEEEMAKN